MGKISSNLITEKALRATRINKALENFFKAHGGSWVVGNSSSIPEHILYTARVVPSEHSRNGYVGVSRKVLKYTPGKGTGTYTTSMFDKDINRFVANALNKASGHEKEMSRKHFKETSTEPASNSAIKNSKAGKGGLTVKGWRVGWDPRGPVAYAANAYGMGSGGGYMPVGEHTVDQLRIQHGKDELSNQGTNVPINPQGTMYLDPELGIVDTQVLEDEDGIRYYKNAQTGQFDPLDSGAPFRYSSIPVEQTPFPKSRIFNIGDDANYPTDSDANKPLPHISADQLARNNIAKAKVANFNKTADYLNDIISGVIKNIPQDISKLPLPPTSTDTAQPVQPVVKPKRMVRPPVVNNTPVANVTPVQPPVTNTSTPVAAPTLSSVVPQAVRHNGGFDNYRRESVLSALRAAGGISPAEAVQRGIIPWEALNYV